MHLKGTVIQNTVKNAEALQRAGIQPKVVGWKRDRLVIPHVTPREAVRELVERELRAVEGFEGGTAIVQEDQGGLLVQFLDADGRGGLEFSFQGESFKAVSFDGTTETPLVVTDSMLVRLAEKAKEAYYAAPLHTSAISPAIPEMLLAEADVDDDFVQRLIAGRRLVVLANWSGTVPPVDNIDKVGGVVVTARRQRAAEIVAHPSGLVDIVAYRVGYEADEYGVRHVVRNPEPERSWRGQATDAPIRWRSAAMAAVEAAKAAVADPAVATKQVVWEDPPRWERKDKSKDVEEMS